MLVSTPVFAAEPPRKPQKMQATAYCQVGKTSSGIDARPGIVAADPRVLPQGTVIHVTSPLAKYSGIYSVQDTGAAVKGRIIDIYIPDCRAARRFGRRKVLVSFPEWAEVDERLATK